MAARMSIGLFQAARQRHFGIVDPTLADVLGRPTTSLRDVLAVSLAEAEAAARLRAPRPSGGGSSGSSSRGHQAPGARGAPGAG